MARVAALLKENRVNAVLIPDHVPSEGLRGPHTAYTIGYMRVVVNRSHAWSQITSKHVLQSELKIPVRDLRICRGDAAEEGGVGCAVRRVEMRPIECVEHLEPEFHTLAFKDRPAARQADVPVVHSRPGFRQPAEVSVINTRARRRDALRVRGLVRILECGRREPQIRVLMEASGNARAYTVGPDVGAIRPKVGRIARNIDCERKSGLE